MNRQREEALRLERELARVAHLGHREKPADVPVVPGAPACPTPNKRRLTEEAAVAAAARLACRLHWTVRPYPCKCQAWHVTTKQAKGQRW